MAPRASWKGYLKLSLVSCPVRLYPATSSSERVRFNQLHKETHNRINMKPVDPELGLVERSDLVKGYEYEDKKYIIIDDEDLEAVRLESNHTLNIESFVDAGEVDALPFPAGQARVFHVRQLQAVGDRHDALNRLSHFAPADAQRRQAQGHHFPRGKAEVEAAGLGQYRQVAGPLPGRPPGQRDAVQLDVSPIGMFIVFAYIWLPYMIIPIQTSLERVPNSLLEASSDLGARPGQTFRTVILPLAFPGVVAGSIFTFSLTLGDFIVPLSLGNSKFFIGQAVYSYQGTAGNIPLAAAMTMGPVVIMLVYLLIARRLGAFDAL